MYFVSRYMSNKLDNSAYGYDSYAEAKKFLLDDVKAFAAAESEDEIGITVLNDDSPFEAEGTWYARITWTSGEFVEWTITADFPLRY